jgi:hypothetical protein
MLQIRTVEDQLDAGSDKGTAVSNYRTEGDKPYPNFPGGSHAHQSNSFLSTIWTNGRCNARLQNTRVPRIACLQAAGAWRAFETAGF